MMSFDVGGAVLGGTALVAGLAVFFVRATVAQAISQAMLPMIEKLEQIRTGLSLHDERIATCEERLNRLDDRGGRRVPRPIIRIAP